MLSGRRARARTLRAERAVEADLPEVIDLFVLAVGAGLTVPDALAAVAARTSGQLGAALRAVVARVDAGRRLGDELGALVARLGEPVRSLVGALVAAHHDGSPVAAALERMADEIRRSRRHRAQEHARRVSVLLLFPLVVCILPACALLSVVPMLLHALATLRGVS